MDAVSIKLRERCSPAFNTLVCVTFKNGTPCERDRVALDAGAFIRVVAEDVHVSERRLRRAPNVSCWIDPVALGELAVQTAAGHGLLLFNRSVNLVSWLIRKTILTSIPRISSTQNATGASMIISKVQAESDMTHLNRKDQQ